MSTKYKIIYADPPWSYNNKISNGAANNHYQTMNLNDIKSMDVNADQDAVLALWVTSPLLVEGLEVISSWGFKYKTVLFNWNKRTKHDKPFFGGGNYTRAGSELCLLGVRGKGVKRINASIRQVVTVKVQEHSRKPSVVRDHLVGLFGDVRRIEMFARETVDGWDSFGDQTRKFN